MPVTLVEGEFNNSDYETAAKIVARFSQGRAEPKVTVQIQLTDGTAHVINVAPMLSDDVKKEWYV